MLVVAVFTGPVPIVVGTAVTVCGFAGAQAVLVSLAPDLVAADDRDTAQGLRRFRWPSPCSRHSPWPDSSSA